MALQPANFTGPASFKAASPYGRVKGHGCPGTTNTRTAAKGVYSPGSWQSGGASVVCLSPKPNDSQGVMGPFRSGHPDVSRCANKLISSDTSMRGGSGCTTNRIGPRHGADYQEAYSSRGGRRTRRGGACNVCTGTLFGGGRRRRRKRTRRRSAPKRRTPRWRRKKPSRRRRRKRAGGARADSNVPLAYGYSLGGQLSAADSALANPPPLQAYDHCQSGAKLIPKTA